MPFATYVVPFDFSQRAEQALDLAAAFAKKFGGKLRVLHGMQMPLLQDLAPMYAYGEFEASLRTHLVARLEGILKARGAEAEIAVRNEPIEDWIHTVDPKDDAVVMLSRHGWSRHKRGFGSRARHILRASRAPVWILPTEPHEVRGVLAAIDLGAGCEKVAATAKRVARGFDGALELITVRPGVRDSAYLREVEWQGHVADPDVVYAAALEKLRDIAATLREETFSVGAHIDTGAVADAVVAHAQRSKAGLVVCGKHARGKFMQLLLGSNAEELAAACPTHVLVVP